MAKRVACLLSGCGNRDGAEINEAVMSILALRLKGVELDFFGLDRISLDTIDHLSGRTATESRNALREAARIVRGKIKDVSELKIEDYQGLAIPGGMGVAKNFCNFALEGEKSKADPKIESVIAGTLIQKKPILAICIAPALVGLVAKNMGISLKLTLGSPSCDAAKINTKWGHSLIEAKAWESVVDNTYKVISTPAFMCEIGMEEAWPGIERAANTFVELL